MTSHDKPAWISLDRNLTSRPEHDMSTGGEVPWVGFIMSQPLRVLPFRARKRRKRM